MNQTSRHVLFDPPAEIFATDNQGSFRYPLTVQGEAGVHTAPFDEMRISISIWHPADPRVIELDRAYVELRGCLDPRVDRWSKLAEIEPIVSPYGSESFDGWLILPVLAGDSRFLLAGSGFAERKRVQLRASAYLVT